VSELIGAQLGKDEPMDTVASGDAESGAGEDPTPQFADLAGRQKAKPR